ncbi:MAG: hypothetical protein AAF633_24030 [Chloroflexota bacterium]
MSGQSTDQKFRVQRRKKARRTINDMSISLLVIGGCYCFMGLVTSPLLLWEGTITAVLAILLSRTLSRGASILLIVMSVIAISNSFVTMIGLDDFGQRNLPLGFISIWCAWKSLQATQILRGRLNITHFI